MVFNEKYYILVYILDCYGGNTVIKITINEWHVIIFNFISCLFIDEEKLLPPTPFGHMELGKRMHLGGQEARMTGTREHRQNLTRPSMFLCNSSFA